MWVFGIPLCILNPLKIGEHKFSHSFQFFLVEGNTHTPSQINLRAFSASKALTYLEYAMKSWFAGSMLLIVFQVIKSMSTSSSKWCEIYLVMKKSANNYCLTPDARALHSPNWVETFMNIPSSNYLVPIWQLLPSLLKVVTKSQFFLSTCSDL